MKKTLAIILLATSVVAFADNHEGKHEGKKEEMKAKREAMHTQIEEACKEDAKAAGCEGKEIGKGENGGLLKCIHAYKEKNKDFKLSESCKNTRKSLKDEKKAWKAEKAAAKAEKKAEENKPADK
jgi:hypothetical protein